MSLLILFAWFLAFRTFDALEKGRNFLNLQFGKNNVFGKT